MTEPRNQTVKVLWREKRNNGWTGNPVDTHQGLTMQEAKQIRLSYYHHRGVIRAWIDEGRQQ